MTEPSKIKLTFSIVILSLIVGGVVLPLDFALSQSYMVDLEGYYLVSQGSPGGRISHIERSINLPYYGRYEVTTYYNANSGRSQPYEEFKVLVDGRYIGQTSDPNTTTNGPDYETEYLGEHDFTAGDHQVRLEHLWNYSEVSYQSVHLERVTFTLKEIFAPEFSLSKSVNRSAAQEGEILTYILSYQNRGSGSASGVVLSDDYDENYLDIYDSSGGTVSGGEIRWNIGTLGAGNSGTKTFKVKIKENLPQGTTYIYNKAVINSSQTEPVESNTVSTRVSIVNQPPIADAGSDKELYEGQSIILTGSGSDPDGDPITYYWSCTGGSLSNRYVAQPIFAAPQVSSDRTYTCTLTVSDDEGLTDSDSMRVTVRNEIVYNRPPVANAGPDKEIYEGQSVTLNGSGSDPDGDPITYQWSCTGGSLSGRYMAQPIFTAPYVSYERMYTCTLTVTDDEGLTDSDSMRVTVRNETAYNRPPVANAGPDKEIYEGQSKIFDSSGWDPDGDPVTFYWSCTGGSLSSRYIARPTFTAPQVGYDRTYTCTLTVSDDKGLTDSDSMRVTVRNEISNISLDVKKSVKNISRGDNKWYNSYRSANPEDELLFRIVIKSTGDDEAEDVKVRDTLPSKIIYQGSLKIDNVSKTKNISTGAINIGNLSPGQSKTITFEAKVASKEKFSYGTTELTNSVRAYTSETSDTDTLKVKVTKKLVAGAATTISTGIVSGVLNSILLPLGIALLMVWIFKSKLVGLDKWAQKRKKETGEYRAEKTLKRKIAQLRTKGYFKG